MSGHQGNALVAVGPGVPAIPLVAGPTLFAVRAGFLGMNPLPIQGAKVHRPPLRDDVLSRERLNTWLDHAATGRLALIVAEAGFGKTTMLADWSLHTQRLTAWYRLEPDDRDWLTFIRHVVGSGRELEPEFAPNTFALLLQLGPGGPSRADLVTSLVRELAEFGASHPNGLTLILDDYHSIDGSDETDPIVRAIIERTGPGFSVVIAARSTPRLPLGRLRARGAVARLDGEALCFDTTEAGLLFRDAYHQPLDPDVLSDLVDRTEGWPALLSLVHTNLEETPEPEPRHLVRRLTGARGDLYDYLAEEILAGLSTELQRFLMTVSLLEHVDARTAAAAYGGTADDVRRLIYEAEHVGLLARPDRLSPHRCHPLVRDFLRSRLQADVGIAGVNTLHRRIATALESVDWRIAASHFRTAGEFASAEKIVDASVDQILASGQFEQVRPFLDGSAGRRDRPAALVLRSRVEFARGDLEKATQLAECAATSAHTTALAGLALLNLASILGVAGFPDQAMSFAAEALLHDLTSAQRHVAEATVAMGDASNEGDLRAIADRLRQLAVQQDLEGHTRYASITRLNLSSVLLWEGVPDEALEAASAAEDGFADLGLQGVERVSAIAARASALAHLGRDEDGARVMSRAALASSVLARDEAAIETAKILGDFGDIGDATAALDRAGPATLATGIFAGSWALVSGQLALRRGDLDGAREMDARISKVPCRDVAGKMRAQLLRARIALATNKLDGQRQAEELRRIARAQRSRPGLLLADLLVRLSVDSPIGPEVTQLLPHESSVLSILAEELARTLVSLSPEARDRVAAEARSRPERWRTALRLAIYNGTTARLEAAALLAGVGSAEDLSLLRSLSSSVKGAKVHAVALARRLAPQVLIHDLGAVRVSIGGRIVEPGMRRKVLALLCYLASRPQLMATRDEALDALWPDLGPDTAANSLHQTIYFLRRVFEPDYREGFSAGYVRFDGDVVSLNGDLVDSTSRRCWRLLSNARRSGSDAVGHLVSVYAGRFALDFAYEDWAADYRETLHAAVLAAIETAIGSALATQDYDWAIELAQAILVIDPEADSVERALLRAYRASGRVAAAAEQYTHYSTYMRDQLGVDPDALEDL